MARGMLAEGSREGLPSSTCWLRRPRGHTYSSGMPSSADRVPARGEAHAPPNHHPAHSGRDCAVGLRPRSSHKPLGAGSEANDGSGRSWLPATRPGLLGDPEVFPFCVVGARRRPGSGRTYKHGVVKEAPRREGGGRDDGGGRHRGRHRAAAAASGAQKAQASERWRQQQRRRRRTTEAEPGAGGRARGRAARGRGRGPQQRARPGAQPGRALRAAREAGEAR